MNPGWNEKQKGAHDANFSTGYSTGSMQILSDAARSSAALFIKMCDSTRPGGLLATWRLEGLWWDLFYQAKAGQSKKLKSTLENGLPSVEKQFIPI